MSNIPRPPIAVVGLPQPPGEKHAMQDGGDSIQAMTRKQHSWLCLCVAGHTRTLSFATLM